MRIYQILVDRFSTGNENLDFKLSNQTSKEWMGGNLKGVLKKLEYIKSLSMNAIWLSPIFKSVAYHGYSVLDFKKVDEHFGNEKILEKLVKEAHKKGLKVILDFVPNHVSKFHPFFKSAQRSKQSEYFNWFVFKKWPEEYLCFLDWKELPKLNLRNEDCKNYILEIAEYWIEKFDIDGYRIDHAIGPPFEFWKEFIKVCENLKKDFIFLPEIWFAYVEPKHLETFWFLDSNELKKLKELLEKRKEGKIEGWHEGSKSVEIEEWTMKIFAKIFKNLLDFSTNFKFRKLAKERKIETINFDKNNFHFLDNHDMQRFLWILKNDVKMFVKFLELISKAKNVVIYYGTEIGMTQLKDFSEYKSYADIEARRFMDWKNFSSKTFILYEFKRIFCVQK